MNENDPSAGSPKSDTTLPVLCHLLGFAWLTGIPFANVLAPLVLWLWKRDTHPDVDLHGKESLNFQISMGIYGLIAAVLMFVFVGFILLPVVLLTHVILTIIGAIQASKGNFYRYPLTIHFLK